MPRRARPAVQVACLDRTYWRIKFGSTVLIEFRRLRTVRASKPAKNRQPKRRKKLLRFMSAVAASAVGNVITRPELIPVVVEAARGLGV